MFYAGSAMRVEHSCFSPPSKPEEAFWSVALDAAVRVTRCWGPCVLVYYVAWKGRLGSWSRSVMT